MIKYCEELRGARVSMQLIADAMRAVMEHFVPRAPQQGCDFGCRTAIECVEAGRQELWNNLLTAFGWITGMWNDIVSNESYSAKVHAFLGAFKGFSKLVKEFDESLVNAGLEAEEVLTNEWIGREYVLMTLEVQEENFDIFSFFKGGSVLRPSPESPYEGLARKMQAIVPGITQKEIENLILYQIPLPRKKVWVADKFTGTTFGRYFKIDCKNMNCSFNFKVKNRPFTPLNYRSNAPLYEDKQDGISHILWEYPPPSR